MQFLSELLFRVLESNYTLGNFIYISQVLEMILSETYYREKHNATLEQVVDEFEMSKSYLNAIFQKYSQHAPMAQFAEFRCGGGKLLFSSMGLQNLQQYPESRALLHAIYQYMDSEAFAPEEEISVEEMSELVK